MQLTGAFAGHGGRVVAFREAGTSVTYDAHEGGVCDGILTVAVGALDDPLRLSGDLGLPAATPRHETLASAYRRWGAATPARLRGAFSLLIWDSRRREGLIAVDHLGAGSAVYVRRGESLTFATEIRALLPLLDGTPPPDERTLVRWLVDGLREPDETLLAGVRRLPGGHLLRLGTGRLDPEPYWHPTYARPRPVEQQEAVRELRVGLEQATQRACARDRPNGIMLSGGLDSSAVAAVARSGGADLVAYSAVFPNHPAADESTLIAERAQALGVRLGLVSFRRGGSLAAGLRYLDSWKLPPASPNLFFHELLLGLASREGVATMLDGQGGDELFGRSPYLVADRLRSGRLIELRRLLRLLLDPEDVASPAARRHVLREVALKGALPPWPHGLARRLRPARYAPSWLTTAGAALHSAQRTSWTWKEQPGPRWWAYLADGVTRGRERAGAHDFFRHAFADAGLRGSHPLLEDVDLVETMLSLPPELAFDRRFDRPLLREALVGVLPDPIRLRPDKSFFNDLLADAVHVEDDPAIRRLLGPDAEIRRYVRGDLFDRLRAVPPGRRGGRETWLLWRLALAESWLRMQVEPEFARKALETWALAEPEFELQPSRV